MSNTLPEEKTCTKCGETKPLENFAVSSRNKTTGRTADCRDCRRASNKARYHKDRDLSRKKSRTNYHRSADTINERRRTKYSEDPTRYAATRALWERRNRVSRNSAQSTRRAANLEKARARGREASQKFRTVNPERAREIDRKSKAKNQTAVTERRRRYYKTHREKIKERNADRRARLLAAKTYTLSSKDRRCLANSVCCACAHPGSTENPLSLEHLIPLARQGDHGIGNFAILCILCNKSKNSLTWAEWKYSSRPRAVLAFGPTFSATRRRLHEARLHLDRHTPSD